MLNGLHKMQKYAPGAKKLWRDLWDAILWLVLVANPFAICVLNLGNQIIKTTLSVIYTNKSLMMSSADKRRLWRK